MKFMLSWNIAPGDHQSTAERFLQSGAPMPEGLTMLGRWHAPGSSHGWVLLESNDAVALSHHVADWSNLLEIDVTPVIEDEDAATALGRAYAT